MPEHPRHLRLVRPDDRPASPAVSAQPARLSPVDVATYWHVAAYMAGLAVVATVVAGWAYWLRPDSCTGTGP